MNLTKCFSHDKKLKSVFTWLTRIGAGRKFGSLPISWYQAHQCFCIDILREYADDSEIRYSGGYIQVKEMGAWYNVMEPKELFELADKKCRA